MNKYYLGIDLGSTTSKAVIIDEQDQIIGRGITNTRANYKVAADIAKLEAIYDARFTLLQNNIEDDSTSSELLTQYLQEIRAIFKYLQFEKRMDVLYKEMIANVPLIQDVDPVEFLQEVENIFSSMGPAIKKGFLEGSLGRKNEFFRDVISEYYNKLIEDLDRRFFDPLMVLFDKSITPVENEMVEFDFTELVLEAMDMLEGKFKDIDTNKIRKLVKEIGGIHIHIQNMVGTGYGRALLPFPEDCIKSEILCHAFGAHAIFPNTRTVLDIGGQDTKAIQVNSEGIVTSFHMNDRCAAGCGRYLGYIADEFSLSLNELGPLAVSAQKEVNICSTCTVFAGAEVRELLNLGEKREDILAGLHKAIVMRAMSLLARSGGVFNEFTFTGGVARNQAVLKYVGQMARESYGQDLTINVHTDSIFMGALGGAMFARRNIKATLPNEKTKIAAQG